MFFVDVIIATVLVGMFIMIILVVGGGLMEDDYMSMYECGFDSVCEVRIVFSYRFFILAMLFIVFDVEVALLLPVMYVDDSIGLMLVYSMFVLILLMGTLYEVLIGSMDWV